MNTQKSKFEGLYYCVVEAQVIEFIGLNRGDVIFCKVIVRSQEKSNVLHLLKNKLETIGLDLIKLYDLCSIKHYYRKWEIEKEINNLIESLDEDGISLGTFFAYEE